MKLGLVIAKREFDSRTVNCSMMRRRKGDVKEIVKKS